MKKIVYLVSCAGRPNYGDELIVAGWLSYIYKFFPDYDVWLDCPEPGNAVALFDRYHPNIKPISTLWEMCSRINVNDAASFKDIEDKVKYFRSPDIDLNIEIFRGADIIHVLGGGYINEKWKQNYGLLLACKALKEIKDVKMVATGLSIYPHQEFPGIEGFDEVIDCFDVFQVRDSKTADIFNVKNFQDDAFLAQKMELLGLRDHEDSVDVLCCIQKDLFESNNLNCLIASLSQYLSEKREMGLSIGYCEAIPGEDATVFYELSQRVEGIVMHPFTDVWLKGLPVSEKTEIISTRFHHHLCGAMLGLKGVAIKIDNSYYDNKHESLLDIGTGWKILGDDFSFDGVSPSLNENFSNVSANFSEEKLEIANSIYGAL